jgi:NTP pyrophosphatase (non-canonical NTP hydrolase)
MTNKNLLKIITHYGLKPQLKYLHTEHYELDEACLIGTKDEVAGELADMFVMLLQIKEYFNITDEQIDKIMEMKTDRQLERIEKEKDND